MSTHDSDDGCMTRLAAGDEPALDELISRWKHKTGAFLYRLLGNETAAAEIVPEVFIRIYQNCGKYRCEGHFSTWLFQIAANLARQRLRWERRHPAASLEAMEESGSAQTAELKAATGLDPAEELERKERGEAVRKAIATLPDDQREALVLQEYEGLSMREIAAIQGGSEKAVENRLYRARQGLRAQLSKWLTQ